MRGKQMLAVLAAALCVGTAAHADGRVYPSPLAPRIVRFVFDPEQTYTLFLRRGMVTDIHFARGEALQSLALGDTVRWVTAESGRDLFIKPVRSGIETSATVVTNARTYQLMLESVKKGALWYQAVTWNTPNLLVWKNLHVPPVLAATEGQFGQTAATIAQAHPKTERTGRTVHPLKLDFRYKIQGSAPFRPDEVFDDGHFTWIRIPKSAWTMPALFVVEHGKWDLTNYDVHGDFLVVQRTFGEAVLRADNETVSIRKGK